MSPNDFPSRSSVPLQPGTPRRDWQLFSDWVTDIKKIFDWNLAADEASILNAWQALADYLEDMVASRRRTLTDDLISELIRAEDDGQQLDHDELLSLAVALLGAGTDTTRHQLAAAVDLLCDQPDQWALLGEQPELVPHAVEEAMRHRPITFALPRIATEDLELAGVRHPGRNDRVCQHRSRQPRPSSLQRSRPIRYHPRQHGRHAELRQRCALLLGPHLARLELAQALHRDGPAHAQPAPYRTSPVAVDDRGHRTHHSARRIRPRTLNPLISHELSRRPMRAPIIDSRESGPDPWGPVTSRYSSMIAAVSRGAVAVSGGSCRVSSNRCTWCCLSCRWLSVS